MPRGEIIIYEQFCKGCGYCIQACSRGCITQPGDKFSPQGYMLPLFAHPKKCNACSICAWFCPDRAIEVYKLDNHETANLG